MSLVTPIGLIDTYGGMRKNRDSCPPLQFIRELVQNSIDAIKRRYEVTGEKGRIEIKAQIYNGVKKLTFADNGPGIPSNVMAKYLNNLYSGLSPREHSNEDGKNYGVGGKISTWPFNPCGVVYISKTEEMVEPVYGIAKAGTDRYGMPAFGLENRDGEEILIADQQYVSDLIKKSGHGFSVTLLGEDAEQDTTIKPTNSPIWIGEHYIHAFLNTRYYTIPDFVEIAAKHSRGSSGDDFRLIEGQHNMLAKNAEANGVLDATDCSFPARIHWWILKPDADPHGYGIARGFVGLLYEREIYKRLGEQFRGTKLTYSYAYHAQLGINSEFVKRVAIIIEPLQKGVVGDTFRRDLLFNNICVSNYLDPVYDYFKANMPTPLLDLLKTATPKDENIRQKIKSNLRKTMPTLLRSAKLIVDNVGSLTGTLSGQDEIEDKPPNQSGSSSGSSSSKSKPTTTTSEANPTKITDIATRDENGRLRGTKIISSPPEVFWYTIDGRGSTLVLTDDSDLREMGAYYVSNEVHANLDFERVAKAIDYIMFNRKIPLDDKTARAEIETYYKEIKGTQLAEVSIAMQENLSITPRWSHIKELLSNGDALTPLMCDITTVAEVIGRRLKWLNTNELVEISG